MNIRVSGVNNCVVGGNNKLNGVNIREFNLNRCLSVLNICLFMLNSRFIVLNIGYFWMNNRLLKQYSEPINHFTEQYSCLIELTDTALHQYPVILVQP